MNPSEKHEEILAWIRDKVSILHFSDLLSDPLRVRADSDRPPSMAFRNNVSCKSFVPFIQSAGRCSG